MKILWLASWYPSELKPYDGDFIQRHAKAASLYNEIYVIHVIKDRFGHITKNKKTVVNKIGSLTEVIIYYYLPFSGLIGKIISEFKYRSIFKSAVNDFIRKNGKPNLIHVHIALKAGIIAKWIKRKYNISYILTEHWTGLLQESKPSLKDYPFIYRKFYRKVISDADSVSTVSKYLNERIKLISNCKHSTVIPNVVDTTIFKPFLKQDTATVKFIHISTLNYQKNFDKIIDAFKIVKENSYEFNLYIVGPENYSIKQKVERLGLEREFIFQKEMPQPQLANLLSSSEALILFSRYETFGCVVIEANACGVPVIVSDIPAMKEIVIDGFNGLFSKNDDANSLAKTIKYFIDNKESFNKKQIVDYTNTLYNFKKIGQMFNNWYNSI